jgi:hypothetical protein
LVHYLEKLFAGGGGDGSTGNAQDRLMSADLRARPAVKDANAAEESDETLKRACVNP